MVKSEENSVDRRNFLKIAAGSGAALVATAPGVGAQVTGARPTEEQKREGAKKVDAPATERTTEAPADNPYTQGMAAFVSGLRYERIPEEVIDRIKLLILDSFGCALYSVDLEWSRILMRTLQQVDSSTSCGVWGTSLRFSAPHAALVNGTLVHGFELDDIHRLGVMHVGAVTLPSLLAVTEIRPGMSGRDFLTAAVAGLGVGARVGRGVGGEKSGHSVRPPDDVGGVFTCVS